MTGVPDREAAARVTIFEYFGWQHIRLGRLVLVVLPKRALYPDEPWLETHAGPCPLQDEAVS